MEKLDLSVIIYVRNREETLLTCLSRFEDQSFPAGRFEVLAVEDGSTDRTPELLRHFAEGAPIAVHTIELDSVGAARGRNVAAERALGRWILFFDADLLACPKLVEKHVRAQEAFASQCAIVGNVTLHPQMAPHSFTRWVMPETHLDLSADRPLEAWEWRGSNLSLTRSIFLDAGGLTEDFHYPVFGDIELGWRLGNAGVEARFIHGAQAHVWRTADFGDERRRQYAKGYALHALLKKTGLPRMLSHYRIKDKDTWGHRLEAFYMPYYARTCAKAEAGTPLFNQFYRRVLRYDLRRGYHDARRGRRPREESPNF